MHAYDDVWRIGRCSLLAIIACTAAAVGVYRLCDPRGGVVIWRCVCFLCRAPSAVLCCVAVSVVHLASSRLP